MKNTGSIIGVLSFAAVAIVAALLQVVYQEDVAAADIDLLYGPTIVAPTDLNGLGFGNHDKIKCPDAWANQQGQTQICQFQEWHTGSTNWEACQGVIFDSVAYGDCLAQNTTSGYYEGIEVICGQQFTSVQDMGGNGGVIMTQAYECGKTSDPAVVQAVRDYANSGYDQFNLGVEDDTDADTIDAKPCNGQVSFWIAWLVCPAGEIVSQVIDALMDLIGNSLRWSYLVFDSEP